jgi:ATP-dependent RNA helicase DDX35
MSGFWKPASTAIPRSHGFKDEGGENGEYNVQAPLSNSPAPCVHQRMLLPIYKHRRQFLYSIEKNGVVVIVGVTGSGKSTQIPQYLLENGWADNDFQIVCTQPRRIAATTLAKRVSEELGTSLGSQVGYCVRYEERLSHQTRIKYVTDGILLREATLNDPLLSKYSVVMVDEAHERSLNSDALLGLIKKIRRKRKELRVIVCSATIDAQSFLDFFVGTNDRVQIIDLPAINVPIRKRARWGPRLLETAQALNSAPSGKGLDNGTIISVDGRQYSVDILYLERPAPDYILATIETAWKVHRSGESGDILCFLPTGADIDNAIRLAEEHFQADIGAVEFLPLYGNLPYHMQAQVFQNRRQSDRKEKQVRRLIFATNVAETSVTVPNISHVIDSGLVKLPYFDPRTGLERLITGPTSQASARQRAGRAGRLQSGKCYRLYTEKYLHEKMLLHTPPDSQRTNLSSFILTLKALGVDNVLTFDLMDAPSVDALSHGLESLFALGAIDEGTHLTPRGMDMSMFPTDVFVSRMLLESLAEGCSWEVLGVASVLQVREVFQRPRGRREQELLDFNASIAELADSSGDHVTFVNLLSELEHKQWDEQDCRERFINYVAVKRALEVRNQLSRILKQFGRVTALSVIGDDSARSKSIRRCVTAGFFFNVAKLCNDGRYYTLRKHILVTPSSASVYSSHTPTSSEYIIFGETIDGQRGGLELKAVSAIEARWLRELAPHYWK